MLAAVQAGRRGNALAGIGLGLALAGCVLVRHVGVCLFAAVLIDLGLRRRWKAIWLMVLTVIVLIAPWVGWLVAVRHNTQAELLVQGSLAARIAGQAVFYFQRLPDQVTGPVVEVGTVFERSVAIAVMVNLWAATATGILIWGLTTSLRSPRRRLAVLVAFLTLALLLVWPFQEAGRFLVPLVPFLLLGATEGLARLMALAKIKSPRVWAVGVVLMVSVPYPAYAVVTGRAAARRRTHADFDLAWPMDRQARAGRPARARDDSTSWRGVLGADDARAAAVRTHSDPARDRRTHRLSRGQIPPHRRGPDCTTCAPLIH